MIPLFDIDSLNWVAPCTSGCASPTKTRFPNLFRTVSFSNQVRVAEIPGKDSMTKRQKQALWYTDPPNRSPGQFKRFQKILCGVCPEQNFDGDEINPAGVRGPNVVLPVSAVLAEQENQRIWGEQQLNDVAIAKVYRRCSAYSAVRAQMRALEYELDAQEYQNQPSKHGRHRISLLGESKG